MRAIEFHGRSLETIRSFQDATRNRIGHQLDRVQRGFDPLDWRPIKQVGPGVRELRVRGNGQFRVIYLAVHRDVVHVLHAFQKKSRRTSRGDLRMAERAYRKLVNREQE
jgi:phage-related protein